MTRNLSRKVEVYSSLTATQESLDGNFIFLVKRIYCELRGRVFSLTSSFLAFLMLSICLRFSSQAVIKSLARANNRSRSPFVISSPRLECLGQFSNLDREQDKCTKFAF